MLFFQLLLIFTHVRIFQLVRIGISITMRTQCGLFCKDLDKTKIANTSNIKFSLMACKTSLFLLNKFVTFTCTDLSPKKAYEATKKKKDVISNWSHLNLRRHNFDFHLCNTVVAVDLFAVLLLLLMLLQ